MNKPGLSGLYHLASDPISKFDVLSIIKDIFNLNISILKDESFVIDRSLNADKYNTLTGFKSPNWIELIKIMKELH